MHPEVLDKESQEIFSELEVFSNFYLAGGTALALQIGHRQSVDFDFFSNEPISKDLFARLKAIFSGATITILVNNIDELTVLVDNIKITFLKYPFATILDLVTYKGIKMLCVKEIAVTKAYTIGRRGSLKDYIDLYFIMLDEHSSLNEIIELAEKKYDSEFNTRLFMEQLLYIEDIEEDPIIFIKQQVEKSEMENFFASQIKTIVL
jgi:hypothetical protein